MEASNDMRCSKEHVVGILMLLALLGVFVAIESYEMLETAITLSILGIFSSFLWSFKPEKTANIYLIKVPLNIILNIFLWVLLLKAWTMLDYKKELGQLDLRQKI
jgi:hypothetical protein